MLDWHYNVAMGGPPSAQRAVVVEVGAKAVAEDYQIPSLLLVEVVDIEWGVSKHGHFHLEEERHNEVEDPEGKPCLQRIDKGDLIQSLAVTLRRNPLRMLSISHRRIKDRNLILLFLDILVACIVGPLPNNLNMVKLHVDNQESEHRDTYSLQYVKLKVICGCDEEEYRCVWPCSLKEIPNDVDH